MNREPHECPKCGRRMQPGYLLENRHQNRLGVTEWVEGRPEKSFWMGLTSGMRPPGCARASLATGLLAALLSTGCVAAGSPPPRPDAGLTVLVYNIHAGKDARGVDNLERVAGIVRETAADVVLLQEVDRGTARSGGVDQLAELARLTGMYARFGKSLTYQGGDYGIAVLSRWPVLRDSIVPLPVAPPQVRSGVPHEPRVAHLAVLESPHGPLHVVNTHIDASREPHYRLQEAESIVRLARALRERDPGLLLLVGGDMNSEPGSSVQALVADGGLRDAWPACGTGEPLTFPADSAVKRIDYLYLTGRAGCARAEVLRDARFLASDHRALLVRVTLPRRD